MTVFLILTFLWHHVLNIVRRNWILIIHNPGVYQEVFKEGNWSSKVGKKLTE